MVLGALFWILRTPPVLRSRNRFIR
jgi:hypothetical protein